jgi:hypothetical protein
MAWAEELGRNPSDRVRKTLGRSANVPGGAPHADGRARALHGEEARIPSVKAYRPSESSPTA